LPGFDKGGKFLSSSDVLVFLYDFQDVYPMIAVYLTDLDDGVLCLTADSFHPQFQKNAASHSISIYLKKSI
jgi:hypothetical protein